MAKTRENDRYFPVNVQLSFSAADARKMWIEAVGQGFPIVMRNRRIQMMFKMIEVIEGDQSHSAVREKASYAWRSNSVRIVGNVNGHKRKHPASRDHQCDIDEWRGDPANRSEPARH